jgi:hypothetical protein
MTASHPTAPVPQPLQRNWPWWLAIVVYFSATCLGHLQFSLWLVRSRSITLGGQIYNYAYSFVVPWLAGVAVVALFCYLWRQAKSGHRPWSVLGYWFVWIACVVSIDRYLTYSANEYAHYPQYAFLAWLLAKALDPTRVRRPVGRILFWTTLLGMFDELLQYLWITRSYSDYLDFNDFLVNLLAAAAGTMLYYGMERQQQRSGSAARIEWLTALLIACITSFGLATGRLVVSPEDAISHPIHLKDGKWRLILQNGPTHYGAWIPSRRQERFYVLPPLGGLALLVSIGTVFARFPKDVWPTKSHTPQVFDKLTRAKNNKLQARHRL